MGLLDKLNENTLEGAIAKLKAQAKNAGDKTNPYLVYEEKDVNEFIETTRKLIKQPKPKRNQLSASDIELRHDLIPLKIAESKERTLTQLNLLVEKIFNEGEKNVST
jgi:hypothetical protein